MRWIKWILLLVCTSGCGASIDQLQTGDIIFQDGHSSQSEAIKLATNSPFSHVGLILIQDGETWVFEAHEKVQLTALQTFIDRDPEKHITVMRLKNANDLLDETAIAEMKVMGKDLLGTRYDQKFEWTDKKLYCSELVWKVYQRVLGIELGQPAAMKTFDLDHKEVFEQLIDRYGEVPIHLKVLPPSAIYESELLEEFYQQ